MRYLLILLSCFVASVCFAEQSNDSVKQKMATCSACHGPDGNSTTPIWPKLAEQNEKYLIKQLQDYQKGPAGGRDNATMTPLVAGLSLEDMKAMAAYYAAQTHTVGVANADLVEKGQQLYRGGDMKKGLAACMACHGPRGLGKSEAGYPLLSGQHAEYLVAQLEAYQNKTRSNDLNGIMQDIAGRMDKKDMQAVASYIAGLH